MRRTSLILSFAVIHATTRLAHGTEDDVFGDLVQDLQERPPAPSGEPASTAAPAKQKPVDPQPDPPATTTAAAMNPEISLVMDFGLAWFSDNEHLQTGAHDPTRNGFNLQQLELSLRAPVDPYFRLDAYLVFELDGVELEEVYGTTLDLPGGLQGRFGQFLTRFGRINATHPHAWDFADQPFALGRVFGGEANRGLGVELSWLVPVPWFAEAVVSMTSAGGAESNRSFLGDQDKDVRGPQDLALVTALKQFFDLSDAWSLLWGVSGAFGPNSVTTERRTAIYGTDMFLKYRPLSGSGHTELRLQTEVFHRRRELTGDVLWDLSGYSQLALRFARRWETAGRYEYGSTPFSLRGGAATDPLDPEWTDARHRMSMSLSHLPTEFSRLRIQSAVDVPGFVAEPIYSAFLSAEIAVGAHGAHAY